MCRDFTKDQSMFAEFKDETVDAKERESSKQNMVRKQMLDHDMKHWGVSLIGFDVRQLFHSFLCLTLFFITIEVDCKCNHTAQL